MSLLTFISPRSELQGASYLKTHLAVCSGGYCCAMGVQHTEVPNLGGEKLALFGGYSYDGVSAAIWVQHTEVANLGVVREAFWL